LPLQEHHTKSLQDLGLTLSQAKVYLTIAKLRNAATANQISTFSNVARQDVYRTLTELHELSLIEKIIGKPAKFKAIPAREAVDILIKRRTHETRVLKKNATETFKALAEAKTDETATQRENHEFVLIPKKELLLRRMKKAIDNAQESIYNVTPWREFAQIQFALHEHWEKALNNGVKVRWIIQKQPNANSLSESTLSLLKHPNFKLRTKANNPDLRVGIHDNKEAFVAISRAPNAGESPALYTSNPIFLCILKDYFELTWRLAKDYKPELKKHLRI
jgi:sugar-specific transcriptional regulator TrmB